jgi:hypothetical protein
MNKLNNFILKYLMYASPAVLTMLIWGSIQSQQEVLELNNAFAYFIWNLFSTHLVIWFLVLIYTLFVLLFSPAFRNRILFRLARIKERDERENYIIAQSGRFTFFATLALLVFLLFFSTVDITVSKLPEGKWVDGHKHELSIGLAYRIFDNKNNDAPKRDIVFSTQSFPFSTQNIIILIILWHLGTFYYSSRKMNTVG